MAAILKTALSRQVALLVAAIFFLFTAPCYAVDVTLEWDANTEPDLQFYRVFHRQEGQSYDYNSPAWEGTETRRQFTGLANNIKYCFVVRAVGEVSGEEVQSSSSREICTMKYAPPDSGGRDTEWEINSGEFRGFKFVFDSSGEIPTLGPSSQIPMLNLSGVSPLGSPFNLQPSPTHFNTPVKIFIPCPGYSDLSSIDVYLYDDVGGKWLTMDDADDWIVADSFVEHYETDPNTVALEVKHFSGAQAGVPVSDSGSGSSSGGGGCFIGIALSDS